MEFKLTIRFNAENEADMDSFFQFIENNYPTEVVHGSADSTSLACHTTIVLSNLASTRVAIGAFKTAFGISYKLEIGQ